MYGNRRSTPTPKLTLTDYESLAQPGTAAAITTPWKAWIRALPSWIHIYLDGISERKSDACIFAVLLQTVLPAFIIVLHHRRIPVHDKTGVYPGLPA